MRGSFVQRCPEIIGPAPTCFCHVEYHIYSEHVNVPVMQGVHGAPNGHLSSYSFCLMGIFYMQQPALQPADIADMLYPALPSVSCLSMLWVLLTEGRNVAYLACKRMPTSTPSGTTSAWGGRLGPRTVVGAQIT